MVSAKPIRSHYVPRRVLDGFVDPRDAPYLWVYEKGNPLIARRHPKHVAVERGVYSFPSIDGGTNHGDMEGLANTIETSAWSILDRLERGRKINPKERWKAAAFLAFQLFRTPHFFDLTRGLADAFEAQRLRQKAQDPETRARILERVRAEHGDDGTPSEDEVIEYIAGGRFTLIHDRSAIVPVIPNVLDWADDIWAMSWRLLAAPPGTYFVSSDNPLVRFDPTTVNPLAGLREQNTEVSFALSRSTAMLASRCGPRMARARAISEEVDEINRRTILNAVRWVYASERSEQMNQFVQSTVDSAPRIEAG